MANYYIGFDNGTMGTKIAIYSLDGNLISKSYKEHEIKYPGTLDNQYTYWGFLSY